MYSTKKKLITTICAMAVITLSFVFGTVAYFTDTVTSHNNSIISTGSVKAEISVKTTAFDASADDDTIKVLPGYSFKKTVTAKNIGSYPIYVRVKVDSLFVLAEKYEGREDEIDYSHITYDIDYENWIYSDGYYYYKTPLYKGETTPTLIKSVSFSQEMDNFYKGSTAYVKVRVEIVQSNNNGTNVLDASGWPSSEGGEQ